MMFAAALSVAALSLGAGAVSPHTPAPTPQSKQSVSARVDHTRASNMKVADSGCDPRAYSGGLLDFAEAVPPTRHGRLAAPPLIWQCRYFGTSNTSFARSCAYNGKHDLRIGINDHRADAGPRCVPASR